jgi:16S rRNA (uracil1498-N3)-methyltransferase
MTTAWFYLEPAQWSSLPSLTLTGDEARHCSQVTRHGIGDKIVVFDGQGRTAQATILHISKQSIDLEAESPQTRSAPAVGITLVQALLKGSNMEWTLEKAVELGVQRIIPWSASRCVVRLHQDDWPKRLEKWQRVVLEASKQCGQAWVPRIEPLCSLAAVVERTRDIEHRLIASLRPGALPGQSLWVSPLRHSTALIIGPEGDLSEPEYQALTEQGWQEWSLGSNILRSETAAICALSILGYESRP